MPRNNLPPDLEKKYQADLLDTLARVDAIRAEQKELQKLIRNVLDEELDRVRVARQLLEGKLPPQTELPGIADHVQRKQSLGAVLRRAVDTLAEITRAEVGPTEEERGDELAARREAAHRKLRGDLAGLLEGDKSEVQLAPAPLEWLTQKPGVDVARVEGGLYQLRATDDGAYTVAWLEDGKKRSKLLAIAQPLQDAKDAAWSHHLERLGAAIAGEG